MGWLLAALRSSTDSRRWPSPAGPSIRMPSASGPRLASARVMDVRIWRSGACPSPAIHPAMPHIARSGREVGAFLRGRAARLRTARHGRRVALRRRRLQTCGGEMQRVGPLRCGRHDLETPHDDVCDDAEHENLESGQQKDYCEGAELVDDDDVPDGAE